MVQWYEAFFIRPESESPEIISQLIFEHVSIYSHPLGVKEDTLYSHTLNGVEFTVGDYVHSFVVEVAKNEL